jgi:hypothetical protein
MNQVQNVTEHEAKAMRLNGEKIEIRIVFPMKSRKIEILTEKTRKRAKGVNRARQSMKSEGVLQRLQCRMRAIGGLKDTNKDCENRMLIQNHWTRNTRDRKDIWQKYAFQ